MVLSDVYLRKKLPCWRNNKEKLEKFLGGIEDMPRIPDVMFVVGPRKEQIAIKEAQKLNIPVVAMVDTNSKIQMILMLLSHQTMTLSALCSFNHS